MSTGTISPATDRHDTPPRSALVWDLPTRVFHWSLAVCFAGAWLTSEGEGGRLAHLLFGYSVLGLLLFRLVWGVLGSRHARFSGLLHGPAATWRYLRSLLQGRPDHHVGHNPAGAVAIWLLIGLGLTTAGLGVAMVWAGGEALEDVHEAFATAMLVVVAVHVIGVIVGSVLHRENLPRAMVTGHKHGLRPEDGIAKASVATGVGLLLILGGFWVAGLVLQRPPLGLPGVQADGHDAESHSVESRTGARDDDDDEDHEDD